MAKIKKRGDVASTQPEQEFMTLTRSISEFIAKYRQKFTIAAVAVAAVFVFIVGYSFMKSQQEQRASALIAASYNYYNPANGNADYGRALELFRDVQKKYPDTLNGAIAQYYVGNCLVNLGRPEEALKEYSTFINKYKSQKILAGFVYQRMGYVYEGMGKSDDARKSFEQAETFLGTGVATVELARLYEMAGNQQEAEKKYKAVLEQLGGTTWAMEASSKTQKINPMPTTTSGEGEK